MQVSSALRFSAVAIASVLCSACHAPTVVERPAVPAPGVVLLAPEKVAAAGIVVEPVEEQAIEDTLLTSAVVSFEDLKVSHVFSPVSGRVTKIFAEPGQRVKRGQTLAVLESPDASQAISDMHKAEADVVAAQHDFVRQSDLKKDRAASVRDLEIAEDRFRQAKAELERAHAKASLFRVGSANAVSSAYTLTSEVDGEVMMRSVSLGQEVTGQYATGGAVELFTVGAIDHLWGMADVYEVDVPRVTKGAHASMQVVAYKDRTFEGTVEWVQHVLDPATRTAKVRLSFANPELALLPQMYGTVRIAIAPRRALAVPRSAVLRLGDQRVVFVETGTSENGDRRYERMPIDVDDHVAEPWLAVRHGLEKGTRIVVKGAVLLSEQT